MPIYPAFKPHQLFTRCPTADPEDPDTMLLAELFRDEDGASAIEYSLIVALVIIAVIGALQFVGTNLSWIFNSAASDL